MVQMGFVRPALLDLVQRILYPLVLSLTVAILTRLVKGLLRDWMCWQPF